MYRATTPVHTFTLPSETSFYKEIQVMYKQGRKKIVKHYQNNELPEGMTLDGKNVIIRLTQEETLKFDKGKVNVQIRVMTNADDVMASQKFSIDLDDCYSEDVLDDSTI